MHRKAILALSLLVLSGCAMGAPRQTTGFAPTARPTGPRDPAVLLGYSQLTRDGLRIAAKLDPGTYPFTDVSISYITADASDPAPYTTDEFGRPALIGGRSEKARFDSKDEEIEFTIGKGGLSKIGSRVVWYRWTVRFDKGGSEKLLTSGIYRTSRGEAGLPRASEAPGPDTSVIPGPAPVATKR